MEKKLKVDELIRETKKCRKSVGMHFKAGLALRLIASYKPKEFLKHLQNFKKGLEAPNWQNEELMLVLLIDNTIVEFQNNPDSPRVLSQHPSTR